MEEAVISISVRTDEWSIQRENLHLVRVDGGFKWKKECGKSDRRLPELYPTADAAYMDAREYWVFVNSRWDFKIEKFRDLTVDETRQIAQRYVKKYFSNLSGLRIAVHDATARAGARPDRVTIIKTYVDWDTKKSEHQF